MAEREKSGFGFFALWFAFMLGLGIANNNPKNSTINEALEERCVASESSSRQMIKIKDDFYVCNYINGNPVLEKYVPYSTELGKSQGNEVEKYLMP